MADRKCKQIFALLSEFLDGELPTKDCRTLERHMKDCKPCLAYLETLRVTMKACRQYGERSVPQPPANVRSALAALMKSVAGRSVKKTATKRLMQTRKLRQEGERAGAPANR